MKALFIALLFCAQAFATCHAEPTMGSNVYFCPGGDPTTVGADLRNFLDNTANYVCGSKIILQAGQVYLGLHDVVNSYPFNIKAQNCAPGKRTYLTTTRAHEMPWVYRPTVADIPRMAVLKAAQGKNTASGSILAAFPGAANGWLIEGIAFSTDKDISQVQRTFFAGPQVNVASPSVTSLPADDSKDITLHHCLATNGEEEFFGSLLDCKTIACVLRSSVGAWVFGGRNLELSSSTQVGQGGFRPDFGSALSVPTTFAAFPNPGANCHVGETFTVNGTTDAATGHITAVNGSNQVTAVAFDYGGWGYQLAGDFGIIEWATTMTSGTCTGLTMYINGGDQVHYSITAATNGVSPRVTHTGISSIIGIAPEAFAGYCRDPITGRHRCMHNCWAIQSPPGCQLVLAEGFPSDWVAAGVGGAMFATYVDANTVALSGATRAENEYIEGSPLDTTGLSAYTSGAVIRPAGSKIDPVYNWQGGGDNTRMINISLQDGDMTLFTGSGGAATSYGTVTASTFNSGTQTGTLNVTVSNAPITGSYAGSTVGDIVVFKATGMSVWCGGGPVACTAGGQRSGRITAISGTYPNLHFDLVPIGANGMDVPGTIGGAAQWKGLTSSRYFMTRSHIARNEKAFPTGKGPYETKTQTISLWDGNQIDWSPFHETKNQGTGGSSAFASVSNAVPWATCRDSIFSNSWWGTGTLAVKNTSGSHVNGNDYESTITKSKGCRFENNLAAAMVIIGGYTAYNTWAYNDDQSGPWHNTMYVDPLYSPSGNWFVNNPVPMTCSQHGVPSVDESGKTEAIFKDNIMSYGNSFYKSASGQNCWPNQDSAVHHNGLIDDKSVGLSTITTEWPLSNIAVNSVADVKFMCGTLSTCRTAGILEHALDPTSPFKGAASDGKDMGADVFAIYDHLNGFSIEARLLRYESSIARLVNNPDAFVLGATHAAITFLTFSGAANCSLTIYADRARVNEHSDTNTAPKKACNRIGNLYSNDGLATFVLNSLSPSTIYAYKIVDGPRTMVGEFTTPAAESTRDVTLSLKDASATDAQIQFSANADLTLGSTTTPVSFSGGMAHLSYTPAPGVRYWRWQKRTGGTVTMSGAINVVITGITSPGTSWVTGITPGGTRTLNGPAGAVIAVGASPITVTALGRYCLAGNSGTHDVKIYNNVGTEIGTGSVNMAGCPPGAFVYSGPVSIALSATTDYFLASIETAAGDLILDFDSTVTTTSAAADSMSAFFAGSWTGNSDPGHQYVGVSFKY